MQPARLGSPPNTHTNAHSEGYNATDTLRLPHHNPWAGLRWLRKESQATKPDFKPHIFPKGKSTYPEHTKAAILSSFFQTDLTDYKAIIVLSFIMIKVSEKKSTHQTLDSTFEPTFLLQNT